MGVELEARHHAPPRGTARGAAHVDDTARPHRAGQQDRTRERRPRDWLVRAASWPLLLVIAACEIAWLLLLAYAAHTFLLQPVLGY
jgi:hypothetical protein